MKKLIIVLFIFCFNFYSAQNICSYNSQTSCQSDQRCYWGSSSCLNTHNCSGKSANDCKADTQCQLTSGVSNAGECLPKNLNCYSYNNQQCLNNPLCIWLSMDKCVPNIPAPKKPNCYSLNDVQCLKNTEYCYLQYSCSDNTNYCKGLTQSQCQADKYCKYYQNNVRCNYPWCPIYYLGYCYQAYNFGCKSLNYYQCKANNSHCYLLYGCDFKKLPSCDSLTIDQCKKSSYCHVQNDGQCLTPDVICPKTKLECQNFKYCEWHSDTQSQQCVSQFDCSKYSASTCSKYFACQLSPAGCKLKQL